MESHTFEFVQVSKYVSQEPSEVTRRTLDEYPKILHAILLEGHNYLYQGIIPDLQYLPANIHQLSQCCRMNLTWRPDPDAKVWATADGYEFNFTAGVVFSALEMAFLISAMGYQRIMRVSPKQAKELKLRLSDCSHWKEVKGPAQFAYLDDPVLWACLKKASPFCPRDKAEMKEIFGTIFPTILFAIAAHERGHIMRGHLRMIADTWLHEEPDKQEWVSRALELDADIYSAAFQCAYLAQLGASHRQLKAVGYCILGAFMLMHFTQQGHRRRAFHPTAKVRYFSTRNVLAATDGVFHPLTMSSTAPVIEGLNEFAEALEYSEGAFPMFRGAFEDGARMWAQFEAIRSYGGSSAPAVKDDRAVSWKTFFHSSHDEAATEAQWLLESASEMWESRLHSYAEEVFDPDTWKENGALSWIGDENELE